MNKELIKKLLIVIPIGAVVSAIIGKVNVILIPDSNPRVFYNWIYYHDIYINLIKS